MTILQKLQVCGHTNNSSIALTHFFLKPCGEKHFFIHFCSLSVIFRDMKIPHQPSDKIRSCVTANRTFFKDGLIVMNPPDSANVNYYFITENHLLLMMPLFIYFLSFQNLLCMHT